MLVFRKIKPSSIETPYKEDYEYLLVWLSGGGGVRQFLFSSTNGVKEESFNASVIDTVADYRGVPNSLDTIIELFSTSLSRENYDYVSSVFNSNRIVVVNKDLSATPVAIKSAKKKTPRIVKDFDIKFKIMLQEPDLMNV